MKEKNTSKILQILFSLLATVIAGTYDCGLVKMRDIAGTTMNPWYSIFYQTLIPLIIGILVALSIIIRGEKSRMAWLVLTIVNIIIAILWTSRMLATVAASFNCLLAGIYLVCFLHQGTRSNDS